MPIFSMFSKPTLSDLLDKLRAEHPGSDRLKRFVYEVHQGVPCWYDTEHQAGSGFGTLVASRAITLQGNLFWRVDDAERGLVFHAEVTSPYDAMDHALRVWDHARQLRDAPGTLDTLIQDIRRGAISFRVELDDAAGTPLSTFGFRALLDGKGLFGISRVSARSALRMARQEPLVTHVIYAAWMRQRAMPMPERPIGFEAMC